jgi:hypothetical protein
MHRILYFGGLASGAVMLILSILIWFKLGIRKAFKDTINYGSKKRWAEDAGMKNKTMPLRKTRSGRLFAGKIEKKAGNHMVKSKQSDSKQSEIEETVLLENYHGQTLEEYRKNVDFEVIEEINLIAGGR